MENFEISKGDIPTGVFLIKTIYLNAIYNELCVRGLRMGSLLVSSEVLLLRSGHLDVFVCNKAIASSILLHHSLNGIILH